MTSPAPAGETAPEIQQLKEEREKLRLQLASGTSGRMVVESLSDALDNAIANIWARLKPPAPAALVAVGGYGRREQCPASDVDLMVLHSGDQQVSAAAKALFYELWDAGLQVGHSIRTIKEALKMAKEDFAAETSFLTPRLIAGDENLFNRFALEALNQSKKSPEAFLQRIKVATAERRERGGDVTAELEPNLKDGRGGLRDLETIKWIDAVCGPQPSFSDPDKLEQAADFLLRVRSALHFATGRHTDVLLMQLQSQVTELINLSADGSTGSYALGNEFASEDLLIRKVYEGSRGIAFALDYLLDPRYRAAAAIVPADLIEGRWNADTVRTFIDLLASGADGWPAFRYFEQTGGLTRAIPEWEAIRCLPQRNVYHRHAVDVHCFETSIAMARFFAEAEAAAEPGADQNGQTGKRRRFSFRSQPEPLPEPKTTRGVPEWEEMCVRVAGESAKLKDRLLLTAFLHDIGKGTSEDHSLRGVRLSRAVLGRMGIPLIAKEDAAWLVRNHLLLTKTAVRRNIEDESLVVELAETMVSLDRLRMLYLISAADGLATGPTAWSGWTATLVSDLFSRVYHVLDKGELVNPDASRTAHTRESELRAALGSLEPQQIDDHLAAMPRMWFLTQPLPALIKQSKLMIPPPDPQEIRLEAARLDQPDHWEVTVVGRDRPGIFSKVSGALSLHGLNVLSAQIFTRQDGTALEIFNISGQEGKFERVRQDVLKALRGKISLDLRLAQKRSSYSGRISKGKQEAPQVRVDNTSSDFYTVIEVHAEDRIGLLYDITRALTELELDILLAKVATYAHDVVDVFYVWDLEGQKVTEHDHLREIERLILHRLSQD